MREVTRERAEAATDQAISDTIKELEAQPGMKDSLALEKIIDKLLDSREETILYLMTLGGRPSKNKPPLMFVLP